MRRVHDRRVADFIEIDAYLFEGTYADGLATEAVVNPEFGSEYAAQPALLRHQAGCALPLPAYADVFRPGARVQVRVRVVHVRDRDGRADQVVLASGESARRGLRLTLQYTTR